MAGIFFEKVSMNTRNMFNIAKKNGKKFNPDWHLESV